MTPNDHKDAIKSIFFHFLTLWPLKWPLQTLLAFFNILWASWCLLRPLVPENVKSLQKQCFFNFEINLAINSQCEQGIYRNSKIYSTIHSIILLLIPFSLRGGCFFTLLNHQFNLQVCLCVHVSWVCKSIHYSHHALNTMCLYIN